MEKALNPFLLNNYLSSAYFCDRENETKLIKSNIKNNINTTLFALRRIGKTGLIQHVFNSYANNSKIATIYVDILASSNLKDFTNQLASAIYNRFPENNTLGKKVIQAIKALRPTMTYDTLSGMPELSFELSESKQYEKTVQQLFTFLDNQGIKIIFAIDEFQQILEYPEKNVEAVLRTLIQTLKNTNFIFCGSNQKLMHEIFNDAKRPFFASCTSLHLNFIERSVYAEFIIRMFNNNKRKINQESVDYILDFTFCHTYYTQYLCNYIFSKEIRTINLEFVKKQVQELLQLNQPIYFQYRSLITTAQWELLTAIAKEETLHQAHSKEFINKYNLGTSSMVTRGIESLMNKELIFQNINVDKPYYQVYDKFLLRWLQFQ